MKTATTGRQEALRLRDGDRAILQVATPPRTVTTRWGESTVLSVLRIDDGKPSEQEYALWLANSLARSIGSALTPAVVFALERKGEGLRTRWAATVAETAEETDALIAETRSRPAPRKGGK